MGRLTHLDGLRGVAALLVLTGHLLETIQDRLTAPWLDTLLNYVGFGRIGVVAFFCLSGFVIPFSFRGSKPLRDFAIGRFFRLYPAYWLSIILAALFTAPDVGVLIANTTMLQRLFDVPNVLDVYWTLAVELAFYALCANLCWLGYLSGPRSSTVMALGLFAIASSLSLLAYFDVIPLYSPGFITFLGIMFFGCSCRHAFLEGERFALRAFPWLTFALVAAVWIVGIFGYGTELPAERPLADLIGTYLGVVLFLATSGLHGLLSRQRMVWLGNVSYSLYLLHPLCISATISLSDQVESVPLQLVVIVAALPLSLALASLANRLVEQPGIRLGRLLVHRSVVNAPAGAEGAYVGGARRK